MSLAFDGDEERFFLLTSFDDETRELNWVRLDILG